MPTAAASPFLLFDLGGVLIENNGFERLDALLPHPIGIEALKARWLAAPAVRAFERGETDGRTFANALVDDWSLSCPAAALLDEFAGWPKGFYPGALAWLTTLRATCRIGCLTNSNAVHWQRFGGFAGLFDVALSSHRTGLVKPDSDCFEHAIDACACLASDIVYFDDAPANVTAANRAGMKAIHADGFAAVLSAVKRLGLD